MKNTYNRVLRRSDSCCIFVLSITQISIMTHFTNAARTLAIALMKAIIRDAEYSYGGAGNATVKGEHFVSNTLTRINLLMEPALGGLIPEPLDSQLTSLKQSLALPIPAADSFMGRDAYLVMRDKAIECSIDMLWSHLNLEEANV